MDLLQFTLAVVSATSIIISVTLIAVFISGISIMRRLNRIFDKLEIISQTGVETSQAVKSFTEKTTDQISKAVQAVVTFKGAQELIHTITEAMSKHKTKEKEDGKQSE